MATLGSASERPQVASIAPIAVPVSPVTELRYSLDRVDVFRSRLRTALHNRVVRGMYAILVAWNVWRAFQAPFGLAAKIATAAIAVAFIVTVLVATHTALIAATSFLLANRGVLGNHVLTLTDDGLLEKTDVSESKHRWGGMYEVRAAGDFIYVYLTEMQYHPIPRRAFRSAAEADAFMDDVRARIEAARARR